ncbi:MAG TPA: HesA/MoeB/ThiF family protein [Candidatus Angelobacter sp.]|nr:HesA/MoeB/ThiF family protein [Candidatus Angelobacter sp.]
MNIQSHDYFSREISIPGIGQEGLHKLQESSIAIIGVGGVGSAAAYYLSRSGVGHLRLIDQDIVETSNLQRLHAATANDLFHPKAEVMANKLKEATEWCKIEPIIETVTDKNGSELLRDVDLIIDGLDNFRTRYILNKSAFRNQTPYLFASAIADQAHLALFNPPTTACLECVMPHVTDKFEDSCETLGVNPSITGLTGAIGAGAAIRYLLGNPGHWSGTLATVDIAGPEFLFTKLSRRTDCDVCGNASNEEPRPTELVSLLCGEHTANVLPRHDQIIEFSKIREIIPSENICLSTSSVLVYREGGFTVSLFRNGRFLIGGVEDEIQATRVARKISQYLGLQT